MSKNSRNLTKTSLDVSKT